MKKLKVLLKNRYFFFSAILYPMIILAYLYANSKIRGIMLNTNHAVAYFVITLFFFIYIIVVVVFETIEKVVFHKIQGAKLKIKKQNWR